MSDYYTQYPIVGERQHSGLGNSPEPIETIKIETFYDEDGRECGSMLTFQGQDHAENWYGGPYPSGEFLLHQDSGRTGSLRPLDGLQGSQEGHGDRETGLLHPFGTEEDEESPSHAHNRRLTFPLHVHIKIILCAACFGALVLFFHEIAQVTR